MIFVFCCDSEDPSQPEQVYQREVEAARACGAEVLLVDHDALVRGETSRAARRVAPRDQPESAVYRGWMVTPDQYADLYEELLRLGVRLINDPAAYRSCHYLPDSYPAIEGQTPQSVWIPATEGFETCTIMERLRVFGDRPLILKDYVKSVKHAWDEACFIPSAADAEHVARVVRGFLEWRGDDLNEGLVFREFVDLVSVGVHPRSGMPLTEEYRVVVLAGRILISFPYWEAESYQDATPPPEDWLLAIAEGVGSRFFTMDVARLQSGGWIVVELGDAQVAGIPEHADAGAFIGGLAERVPQT